MTFLRDVHWYILCVALVCGLTLIAPDTARWFAIGAIVAGAYVASALPRRQPSDRRRTSRVRGAGSGS